MIHYPHNTEYKIKKEYSKGIEGTIERFCEIITIIFFVLFLAIVTVSFYWLIHWVIFGRTIYSDTFNFIDRY